ncbi:ubiquitin-protein transferase activating protein [Chytriomyces hyalinus]|nr:ubiquitin-protein transferase activating protein [Chytriomyces hyalinus]
MVSPSRPTPSAPRTPVKRVSKTRAFDSPVAALNAKSALTPLKSMKRNPASPFKPFKASANPPPKPASNQADQSPKRPPSIRLKYDRYIPHRSAVDMPSSHFILASAEAASKALSETASSSIVPKVAKPYLDESSLAYQEELAKACGISLNSRILAFQPPAPLPSAPNPLLDASWSKSRIKKNNTGACHRRRIGTAPVRILDAPGLADDYYLNLIDWSSANDLAVALEGVVYVWNGDRGDVVEFCRAAGNEDEEGSPGATVCSVLWTADGGHLAVGVGNGDTQIWDLETQTKIRTMRGHTSRVGVLSWDRHLVSSGKTVYHIFTNPVDLKFSKGCRDGSIWHHDVRIANHKVGELIGHTQEVCGLKWRADGGLLASGGNDNLVNIWDIRSSVPKSTKTIHNAAVKAIAWCPWQLNLLATGGGSTDRNIHFWNTTTPSSTPLSSIDTGSQVTSLHWSKTYKEIISSHGFPDNQLSIWAYPSCKKIVDLEGHDARVLHAAMSPDGETVVTGASDENLKFWNAFERSGKSSSSGTSVSGDGVGGSLAGKSVEDELVGATKRMAIR